MADEATFIPAISMAASRAQPTPESPNPVASEVRFLADWRPCNELLNALPMRPSSTKHHIVNRFVLVSSP
jgi:hypothetical protein